MTPLQSFFSLESISFQSDAFKNALTEIYTKYRGKQATDTNITEIANELDNCIFIHTGMVVRSEINEYVDFAMGIPELDRNSPIMKDYFDLPASTSRSTIKEIRKQSNKRVSGWVDLDAAKVGGYFSNMAPTPMYLNTVRIFSDTGRYAFTPAECAAATLHECGHLFTFFEFLVRFRTQNQIMAAVDRELSATTDVTKREIVIREAAEALGANKEIDAADLANKKNMTVYTVLITTAAKNIRSQNLLDGYDLTTAEALADQFAQRHGAGVELVTSLDKIMKRSGDINVRSTGAYIFYEFVKIAWFVLSTVVATTVMGAVAPSMFIIFLVMVIGDGHWSVYDKGSARFKRVRDQIVQALKNQKLSKRESLKLQADLETIDSISQEMTNHTQFLGLLYDYLTPGGASKRKSIEFQQGLEDMTNNRIFQYANALSHVA